MIEVARLRVVVEGEPVPKGRPRTGVRTGRDGSSFVQVYTDAKTVAFEKKVRTIVQIEANRAAWRFSSADFTKKGGRFKFLATVYRTHEGDGGDADNYQKALLDACNGIAWPDDRYVRALATVLEQDAKRPRVEFQVVAVMRPGKERRK